MDSRQYGRVTAAIIAEFNITYCRNVLYNKAVKIKVGFISC